jgi:hypothetical protein
VVPPCSDRISRVPPYSRIFDALRIRGYHPLWPPFPERSAYLSKTTGLFRVRSPLLAESLLMSVPPGTEMFQFPGFASASYGLRYGYPSLGGLPHSDIHGSTPARGSPWLFAACHVLHRLLVPRHPPNALLMLDRPDQTPQRRSSPCTETIPSPDQGPKPGRLLQHIYSAHNRIPSDKTSPSNRLRGRSADPAHGIVHNASEPSPPTVGALLLRTALPVRQTGRTTGPLTCPQTDLGSHAPRDAPEPDSP